MDIADASILLYSFLPDITDSLRKRKKVKLVEKNFVELCFFVAFFDESLE